MSVYLIGEIASTHDGSWELVERLVTLCAQSGFSACKLQYWSSADRLADRRRATPEYRSIYHQYAIPSAWLSAFYALCHSNGIEAVCTVYLPEDVEVVARWSDRIKIASFENEDNALLDAVSATGKPAIVSAGMLGIVLGEGLDKWRMIAKHNRSVLRCVSAYPAALDGALGELSADITWEGYNGFSDHTRNIWTGAVAVGCGAQIIEVHVRAYDTAFDNPDYATALDPDEARQYAQGVRVAERLIADVPVDESAMRRFKVRP